MKRCRQPCLSILPQSTAQDLQIALPCLFFSYCILASVPARCAWIKQYISIVTIHLSVLYVYTGVHSSMFSALTMQ